MISINVTLLIQMVNFLVFLFLMNLILYRPIRRLVAQRNALIEGQRLGIEKADEEVASVIAEFESSLQNARIQGRQKIQELKDAAYKDEKDLMRRAADEAARAVQSAREKVHSDMKVARDQLKKQVKAFSLDLAQKVLGRSL